MKQQQNDTSKELHLIGVAEVHYWHGFDRLVRGLADYYRNNPEYKVYFHIVGPATRCGTPMGDVLGGLIQPLFQGISTGNNFGNFLRNCCLAGPVVLDGQITNKIS